MSCFVTPACAFWAAMKSGVAPSSLWSSMLQRAAMSYSVTVACPFSAAMNSAVHPSSLWRSMLQWDCDEQGATCSPLDHNAGEARRRERVCFPGGFQYKLQLCIDVCTR
jgi:hypothetical protein